MKKVSNKFVLLAVVMMTAGVSLTYANTGFLQDTGSLSVKPTTTILKDSKQNENSGIKENDKEIDDNEEDFDNEKCGYNNKYKECDDEKEYGREKRGNRYERRGDKNEGDHEDNEEHDGEEYDDYLLVGGLSGLVGLALGVGGMLLWERRKKKK